MKIGYMTARQTDDGYIISIEIGGAIIFVGTAKDKHEARHIMKDFRFVKRLPKLETKNIDYVEATTRVINAEGMLIMRRKGKAWHLALVGDGPIGMFQPDGTVESIWDKLTDEDRNATDWALEFASDLPMVA